MSNLRSLSGTITIDDTAGTVQSGNLFVQAGSASKQFGPTVAAERNALGVHIFDFLDAAGDDLSFSVDGSSIHSGFTLCTAYNPCNGLASSLQFSGGGATFLNSSPYAVPPPNPHPFYGPALASPAWLE